MAPQPEQRKPFARQNTASMSPILPDSPIEGRDYSDPFSPFTGEALSSIRGVESPAVGFSTSADIEDDLEPTFGYSAFPNRTTTAPLQGRATDLYNAPTASIELPGLVIKPRNFGAYQDFSVSSKESSYVAVTDRNASGANRSQVVSYAPVDAPTSYEPLRVNPAQLTFPEDAATPVSRSRSIFHRVGSRFGGSSRYQRISEEGERDAEVGVDVGTLEGPIALQNIKASNHAPDLGHARVPSTEANILESTGHLTGGLGVGMGNIIPTYLSAPLEVTDPAKHGLKSPARARTLKAPFRPRMPSTRVVGQEAAEKLGEIVAVDEIFNIDISNVEGNRLSKAGTNEHESLTSGSSEKQSYYFPEDPDMPDWRPVPMGPFYISLLIALAVIMVAVQEYLCQKSQRLAARGEGLLRFQNAQDVSTLDYFAWKYLPTMILVTYGVMWQTTDFEVKRLEPFYQLSQKSGATADASISIDYLTFWSCFSPLKAFRHRQWAVLFSSVATLISGFLIPVFQSASINLYPDQNDRRADDFKFVRVDPIWSRLMEGFLLGVAISGVVLLLNLRRKSGLLSDPKGIAGICAMAGRSHILTDFKGLDAAKQDAIHKALKNRRYILHKSTLWQGEYIRSTGEKQEEPRKAQNPHPVMLRLRAGIPFILFMLIFVGLIPIFMFTDANVVTQKLPWLLTAYATIVKLMWSTLDCDCRMIEPFYILSKRHAPARTLTLDYTGTVPGWMPIKALLNGHYLVSLVSFGAILCEVLTVCVSSFDVDGKRFVPKHGSAEYGNGGNDRPNTGETFRSFWISFMLAMSILVLLAIFACIVYLRRRHPFLPREPGTIASVLAFIHQSKMLYDFVSDDAGGLQVEKLDSRAMTKHLEKHNKLYGIGWYRGRDGQDHLGIDEEELLAPYQHGKDWSKGRVGAESIGAWEHF